MNLKTGVTRKQACQIFRKLTFLTLLIRTRTCVWVSRGSKCSFFGKFYVHNTVVSIFKWSVLKFHIHSRVLCFLVTPVLRFVFFFVIAVEFRHFGTICNPILEKKILKKFEVVVNTQHG